VNWLAPVDGYCERVVSGFGGEPFNALTGLAFLVVGVIAFRRAPAMEDRNAAGALVLVGLASAAQHGFAVELTVWADVAANLLYLVALGVLLLRRLAGAGALAASVAALIAVAAAYQAVQDAGLRQTLGLAADLFAMLTVVLFGAALSLRHAQLETARRIALAAAVLAAGLPFRFLDHDLCAVWPLGTHGIWHLMNAASITLLLSALARHKRSG
jgi:hypothetical protein